MDPIPRADDSSTGEFIFEVPITNLKLEASNAVDISYVTNTVAADNVDLETDTASEDDLSRTYSGTIVIDKTNSIKLETVDNDTNRHSILIEIDSAIPITDDIITEKTLEIDDKVKIDTNNLVEVSHVSINFDETDKNVINEINSGTLIINESKSIEPLNTVTDPNTNNSLFEIDDVIVINDTISEKISVIDNKAKTNNNNLEEIIIDVEETKTNNAAALMQTDLAIDTEKTQIENVKPLDEPRIDSENDYEKNLQLAIADRNMKVAETAIDVDEPKIKDVELLDGNRTDSDVILLDENKRDTVSTIILDDDEINKSTENLPTPNNQIIDVEKDTDCSIVESNTVKIKKRFEHNEIYKDNPLLLELVEKCLDMENPDGMTRVINRTLLVIYRDVDEEYKNSEVLKKILTKTIMRLDVEPEKKFSHIKNLCNELKLHQTKKRVPFITLGDKEDREQSTSCIPTKRRKFDEIIDLDDYTNSDGQHKEIQGSDKQRKKFHPIGKVYSTIEIDDDSSSDVLYQDNDNDLILIDKNNPNKANSISTIQDTIKGKRKRGRSRKSNVSNSTKTSISHKKRGRPRKINLTCKGTCRIQNNIFTKRIKNQTNITNINIDRISDPGVLLKPISAVEVNTSEFNQEKIKDIETRIAVLKKRLEVLEVTEVMTDSSLSPYLLCEQIKTKILNLYKELCKITGSEVNKRHEVRLQVVPGHPEGPVRCLEEFLNNNIDAEGNPPFPDMHDVTECVYKANYLYKMQWTRAQIIAEGQALFTQFGRKMQKRRKKREWKDLLSLVKQEVQDPADVDPALSARLEANTRLARKKEHDLLERFVRLEHGLTSHSDPELRFSQSEDSGTDTDVQTPSTGDEIRTTNPSMEPDILKLSNLSNNTSEYGVETVGTIKFGSTMTVSDGNIIIQPTIKYGLNNLESPPKDDVTLYTSEFKRFLLKANAAPSNFVIKENKYINMKINSSQSSSLPTVVTNNVSSQIAQSSHSHSVFIQSTDLCKPVSDQSVANNGNINPSASYTNTVAKSTNLGVKIVDKNDPAKSFKNNESENMQHSAFKIYTHSTKHKSTPTEVSIPSELNTQSTIDNQMNIENSVKKEMVATTISTETKSPLENNVRKIDKTAKLSTEMSTLFENDVRKVMDETDSVSTNKLITSLDVRKMDSTKISTVFENDVRNEMVEIASVSTKDASTDLDTKDNISNIKRERLDIPSMLEELGEGFTATIFDIEDPFLVIEISDSSESEDEGV